MHLLCAVVVSSSEATILPPRKFETLEEASQTMMKEANEEFEQSERYDKSFFNFTYGEDGKLPLDGKLQLNNGHFKQWKIF